jgi:tetratricopeptide (TPR) repeat protein
MQMRFLGLIGLAMMSLMVCPWLEAAEPGKYERAFINALEAFDAAKSKEDYLKSAEILESIATDGVQSGAIFYNLGNAYFKAGQFGRAILNYRKALPYRPRDPYLRANLKQAIALAPGRLSNEPSEPWWRHVLFWSNWLSYPAKANVCFSGLVAAALMLVVSVYFQASQARWITIGILLFSGVIGLDVLLNFASVKDTGRAVITAETLARKGMGDSYEAAFDQPLRDGAEFTVLNATHEWTLGRFDGIGDGWVRNEHVAR